MTGSRHVRRKNGRLRAVSGPRGGRPEAGFGTTTVHLADPGEKLAFALVYRPIAKAKEAAGGKAKHTSRQLKSWIARAREELQKTPSGREYMQTINVGLATAGAELVELAKAACEEMEGPAVDAAVMFVRLVRRYVAVEPEELELAKAISLDLAIAKAARARLFAEGLYVLSSSRTLGLDEEGRILKGGVAPVAKMTSKLPAGGDLAAMAKTHTDSARLNLLTLRELVADRRSSPATAANAIHDRFEAILAREKRDREAGQKLLAQREKVIDVPASTPKEPEPARVAVPSAPPPTTTPAPSSLAPPPDRIVYEATPPGGIAYPSWARPPAHVAPAAPDPFAEIRTLPDPQRGELGFARVVGQWMNRAQLARDQGKTYAGPRGPIPGFVAKWLRDTGRARTLEHLTKTLGFFTDEGN